MWMDSRLLLCQDLASWWHAAHCGVVYIPVVLVSAEEGERTLTLMSYKLDPFMQRASLLLHLKGFPHRCEYLDLAHK